MFVLRVQRVEEKGKHMEANVEKNFEGRALAEMLKGGVIMDVMNVEQAKIAEQAGAVAVMALERIPSLIRQHGGVARMSDPKMVKEIMETLSIPVMAKCRIGHFVEAQILEELGVDFIDESEVLTPADDVHHIDKRAFTVPFVCGCTNLGEALRRIAEGASLIRTKGEAGTGDVLEAVRHMRCLMGEIRTLKTKDSHERYAMAKELQAPLDLVERTATMGRLPVPNFSAGGVATPADAALMMQLGAESVFVGSGIFAEGTPEEARKRAEAIVKAVAQFNHAPSLLEAASGLPKPMSGVENKKIIPSDRLASRGW